MARYAYDLNRTTRFIDVHKQFNGGLKTVDTDDALGAVFLRDAQNVSLSEFGFIEKRYGTYLNSKEQLDGNLQGYFEFKGYKIYVVNNTFYVNGNQVTSILKETEDEDAPFYQKELRYPTLPLYPFQAVNNLYRDMNAVNINDVLYIFTGYYPVYAKVVNEELKFYWFSVDIPTYDEIVVVGHNLLEDDYESLYFSEPESYSPNGFSSGNIDNFLEVRKVDGVEQKKIFPRIPFANDGSVDFRFQYVIDEDLVLNEFIPDSNLASKLNYKKLDLDTIKYRNSGPGASSLDFINADKTFTDFTFKSNYEGEENFLLRTDTSFLPLTQISSSEISDRVTVPNPILSPDTRKRILKYTLSEELFEVSRINRGDNFEYTFYRETGVSEEPYERIFFPDTLAEYETFLNVNPDNGGVGFFETDYYVSIIPYDLERSYPEEEIIIEKALIEKSSSTTYRFVLPDNLFVNSNIQGYKFKFVYKLDTRYLSSENEMDDDFPVLYKELNKLEKLETVSEENYLSNYPDLGFNFSNLISGTYDFELVYSLTNFTYEDGILVQNSKEFFSIYFYNIIITTEKLQDYPGSEGVVVKPHPIWSCNKVIEHFNKLMVWGSLEMKNSVFYSFPDRPSYFPQNFYLDFGNDTNYPVEAVTPFMNILVVQTPDVTWGVRGNSGLIDAPAPYIPFTINTTVGTIAYKSVRPVRNHLYFLSKQGIIALKSLYAADEQYNIDFVDRNIKNIVPQDEKAVGIQYDNQYWLNFPNFGITLRWYIDKKAWVKDVFAWGNDFKGVHKWQINNGKLEFISYPSELQEDTNPYIYKIGIDESLPADMGSKVITKFETSFLNQNHPFHQKNYKEFKYDFTMQNEYNFSRDPIYDKTFNLEDEVTVLNLQQADLTQPLLRNHTYMLSFSDVVEVDTLTLSKLNEETNIIENTLIENLVKYDGSYYLDGNTDYFFTVPNALNGKFDINIQLTEPLQGVDERVALRDTTYDETMVFLSKVITEERNVINQQLPIGEQEEQESISVNLGDFQDFTLGTTFFGDRVTFVKTIKLSGKGYNTKAYFEDESKAKWTIESMGITYKMKRARSD